MSKLADLKQKYAELPFSKADLLTIILFQCKCQIPSTLKIHKAVYELQNFENFKYEKFVFSGLEPYSEELNSVLFFLGVSGNFQDLNPAYEKHQIYFSDEKIKAIEKIAERNAVNLDEIGELTEHFKTLLN